MLLCQSSCRLNLHDQFSVNEYIYTILTHNLTIIEYLYGGLANRRKAFLFQFYHHRIFINPFQKAIAKFVINSIEDFEYLLG